MPVWHLDLYRIDDPAEIELLDIEQYMPQDGVAFVEWAARAEGRWPSEGRIEIELSYEDQGRRARLRGLKADAGVRRLGDDDAARRPKAGAQGDPA